MHINVYETQANGMRSWEDGGLDILTSVPPCTIFAGLLSRASTISETLWIQIVTLNSSLTWDFKVAPLVPAPSV